jgi:hypothetical protein
VAIQGGLGGLHVRSFDGPLMIQGAGNRDYRSRYQVGHLKGSLTASGIPLHEVDSVKGDVSIIHTAYTENMLTITGPGGVVLQPTAPKPSSYIGILGNLEVKFCRADLAIADVGGRVDIENEFGRTVWNITRAITPTDHRIVSQSGAIEVRVAPSALGKLDVSLFTARGSVRLPKGDATLESRIFHNLIGRDGDRSWSGFLSSDRNGRNAQSLDFGRLSVALRGDRRGPGVDILNRAGTIMFEPIADQAPAR